ncbi:precorrin-6A/cobalt-precorrin-6A reductase [Streptomyces sp. BK022]|uniref:cobalt-precorrin-6A reductase n=1 Tax=Streptomyces sp. BK022 TaxID=2512123 RepID=UPI001029153D|nr:cobalt-precorrin-6A reductase [Streptomyces sp. BK022]RZU45531.1 precorrin-6A/cobalt-precorrin-6A reductase [Streptomyces sp. BK022]
MPAHVLILGGTTESRRLATALAARPGLRVTSSLAGRVSRPGAVDGEVRVGGFGGAAGLADWLRAHRVTALVDATHPFAERITANAAEAARAAGVPHAVLRRLGWNLDDDWFPVASLEEAARLLPRLGRRVFLSTGRLGLAAFAHVTAVQFVVRSVEPPEPPLPPQCELVLAKGPFSLSDELGLLRAHRIDVLVTKDSGGAATAPKLAAARSLSLPVVVVRRPELPFGVRTLPDVEDVLGWLAGVIPPEGACAADTCP